MPAVIRTKDSRYIGESFQTAKGYVVRQKWVDVAAASATSVKSSITTAVVTTSGLTQPDVPRVARIASGGASHNATGNVVINGTDIRGNTIADTIALNGNTAVNGVKAFKTITSVDTTGVSGIGASATVTVGVGAPLGLNRICSEDSTLYGTADGTHEATIPVITSDTDIAKNVVTFNTAPDASKDFVLGFMTTELYAGAN